MEPSGRNQWRPVANGTALKTAHSTEVIDEIEARLRRARSWHEERGFARGRVFPRDDRLDDEERSSDPAAL